MVTTLWVLYDVLVAGWTSFLDRKLTLREKIALVMIGAVVAVYGGYSEHQDSNRHAAMQNTLKLIARKLDISPNQAPSELGDATIKQIDALKTRLTGLESHEWPALSPKTIDRLGSDLARAAGTHRIEVHPCGTRDCDRFADGLYTAFQKARWYQMPIPAYPLMWKAPEGIVISSHGDNDGAAILHNALKDALNIDVQVLPFSLDTKGQRVTLVIGSKPLSLSIAQ